MSRCIVSLIVVLLTIFGAFSEATLNGFENDPFTLSGEQDNFVFRTDEEMTAFARTLPRELPDEQVYLEEIAALQETTPILMSTVEKKTVSVQSVPTSFFTGEEKKAVNHVDTQAAAPSLRPTRVPTMSMRPTREPTFSVRPTREPTISMRPSVEPTEIPTRRPTFPPTMRPTREPTKNLRPTRLPSVDVPTRLPTKTTRPTMVSARPSSETARPTPISARPTFSPTDPGTTPPPPPPAGTPSMKPNAAPTVLPSAATTSKPTIPGTNAPVVTPTMKPNAAPTLLPSAPTVSFPKSVFRLDKQYFNGSLHLFYPKFSDDDAPTTIVSYSLWVNTTKANTCMVTLDRTPSNFNGEGMVCIDAYGKVDYFDYYNGYGIVMKSKSVITTGKRIHIALVKNEGKGSIYINGVLETTYTSTYVVSHINAGLNIGNDARDKAKFFKGRMDNLNIYNYALSDAQVSDLYNYFIQPPTPTPTFAPTFGPTNPTYAPTRFPTAVPTVMPPTVPVILSGANRASMLGFQIIEAIRDGDAFDVTGYEFREMYLNLVRLFNTTRQEIYSTVFTNATTGQRYTSLTWNPTHDSAYFTIADSANTYGLFMSNYDYASATYTPTTSVPVAIAGFYGTTARYSAFGNNPFAVPMAANNDIILRNVITWMNKGVDARTISNFGITIAHLPGASSYWFSHDIPTHKWVTANYPSAKVNAINACDNTALDGCLATSKLLIIGAQMGRNDDTAVTATSTNTTQVTNAVRKFMENGGMVMYVHYYRIGTELGNSILNLMGVSPLAYDGYTNYWRRAGFYNANPFTYQPGATDNIVNAVRTLHGLNQLTSSDMCASTDAAYWYACSTSGFTSKMRYGVDNLKSILNNFDTSGLDLFATPINKYVLEKILVLLGDKYRSSTGATDSTTNVIKYPLVAGDLVNYAQFMFADSSILYRRSAAPKQDDLGTVYCATWNKLLGKTGCADYKNFATNVPRYNNYVVSDSGNYINDVWTSTGVFAIPGVPFKVTRLDSRSDIKLYIAVWYQRSATTKSLEISGTNYNYNRPQYLRSPYLITTKDKEITITAPYGGPIYFGIMYTTSGGTIRTSPVPIQCSFSNVGRHASITDVSIDSQVKAFVADLKTNPIAIADIKFPGYELHFRADYMLNSLKANVDFMTDYSNGTAGLNQLLYDIRYNYVQPQMTLAGFKIPAKTLSQSLPQTILTACSQMSWNCTDTSIHQFSGIQHANFDERAACGNGCSGNPYDADWSIIGLGWGDAHELGHNMQQSLLQISWVQSGKSKDSWANYQNRATENSNNIFPYHNRWRYFRIYKNFTGTVTSGSWNGHIHDYVTLQSGYARINKTVSGVMKQVIYDSSCNIAKSYPLGTPLARVLQDAVYADGSYAADNDARMAFYLQLTFIMTGETVVKGQVKLTNGFEIVTLLYQGLRLLNYYARSDALWKANRQNIGFSMFNRTCATTDPCYSTYQGRYVTQMPGNDYVLVMMTFLSGYDFRPHFNIRGLQYSSMAEQQVLAHIASGVAYKGPVPTTYYAINDYPPASIVGGAVKKLPIDGVTAWPFTGWSASGCASK